MATLRMWPFIYGAYGSLQLQLIGRKGGKARKPAGKMEESVGRGAPMSVTDGAWEVNALGVGW